MNLQTLNFTLSTIIISTELVTKTTQICTRNYL